MFGGVTDHLPPHRLSDICHTRSFLFSLWPCLWVSPCHMVRQTSMKWSCPGDLLEPLRFLLHDTRILCLPEAHLSRAKKWVQPSGNKCPHYLNEVICISWSVTASCSWQVVIIPHPGLHHCPCKEMRLKQVSSFPQSKNFQIMSLPWLKPCRGIK